MFPSHHHFVKRDHNTIFWADAKIIPLNSTKSNTLLFFDNNLIIVIHCLTGKLSKYPGWQGSAASCGVTPSFKTFPVFGKYLSLNRRRLLITAYSLTCRFFAAMTSHASKIHLQTQTLLSNTKTLTRSSFTLPGCWPPRCFVDTVVLEGGATQQKKNDKHVSINGLLSTRTKKNICKQHKL